MAAGLLSTLRARRPERADRPAAAAGKARAPVPGDPRPEAGLPGDEGRPPTRSSYTCAPENRFNKKALPTYRPNAAPPFSPSGSAAAVERK